MGMSCGTMCPQSDDYTGMLDRLVRIIQLCTYGTHIFRCAYISISSIQLAVITSVSLFSKRI